MKIDKLKHAGAIFLSLVVAFYLIAKHEQAKLNEPPKPSYSGFWKVSANCLEKAIESEDWLAECSTSPDPSVKIISHFRQTWEQHPSPWVMRQTVADSDNATHYQITVRAVTENNGYAIVPYEIVKNSGGSGQFSMIALAIVSYVPRQVQILAKLGTGDRCNDGESRFERFVYDVNGRFQGIEFSTAATPFRMLNANDNTDWRRLILAKMLKKEVEFPSTYRDWMPYQDVTNSATACIGRIKKMANTIKQETTVLEVTLDRDAVNSYQPDGALDRCIQGSLLGIDGPSKGNSYPVKDWVVKVSRATNNCTDEMLTSKAEPLLPYKTRKEAS